MNGLNNIEPSDIIMPKPPQWKIAGLILFESQRRMALTEINSHNLMKKWYSTSSAKTPRQQTQRRLDMRVDLRYTHVTSKRDKKHLIFGKTEDSRFFLTNEGLDFIRNIVLPEVDNTDWNLVGNARNDDFNHVTTEPERIESTVSRIARDSSIITHLKEQYNDTCQMCGLKLRLNAEISYSEGAHVRPLSEGGPDSVGNILILCPNHHKLLDHGEVLFTESGKWKSISDSGTLIFKNDHYIKSDFLKYHGFFESKDSLFDY